MKRLPYSNTKAWKQRKAHPNQIQKHCPQPATPTEKTKGSLSWTRLQLPYYQNFTICFSFGKLFYMQILIEHSTPYIFELHSRHWLDSRLCWRPYLSHIISHS